MKFKVIIVAAIALGSAIGSAYAVCYLNNQTKTKTIKLNHCYEPRDIQRNNS